MLFIATEAVVPFSSYADPISGGLGSSQLPPTRSGAETQYMPLCQLHFLLDVVFAPCPVTRRAGAKKGALRLSAPWYTSGKFEIEEKSDQPETPVR